jgi:CHAD domain-containing protein
MSMVLRSALASCYVQSMPTTSETTRERFARLQAEREAARWRPAVERVAAAWPGSPVRLDALQDAAERDAAELAELRTMRDDMARPVLELLAEVVALRGVADDARALVDLVAKRRQAGWLKAPMAEVTALGARLESMGR